MNSSIIAHRANCELQAILRKLEWRREITHTEIGKQPIEEIQDALYFVSNNEKLKNQIITFKETYILDSLISLSMIELVEQEGEAFINNMIDSCRSLVNDIIRFK